MISLGSQGASALQSVHQVSRGFGRRSLLYRPQILPQSPAASVPLDSLVIYPNIAGTAAPARYNEPFCDTSLCHTPEEIQAIQDSWPAHGGIGPELVACQPTTTSVTKG
ncbi:hypothetical protein WJX74_000530 [Apatococcus lobatus]|uniref:Uncharacterized protein n=1 Tax=Apatococcus lobatus TaxID=904363 RepID=A0AAW1RYH6_9CHLO